MTLVGVCNQVFQAGHMIDGLKDTHRVPLAHVELEPRMFESAHADMSDYSSICKVFDVS